jgi:hypothetical protein
MSSSLIVSVCTRACMCACRGRMVLRELLVWLGHKGQEVCRDRQLRHVRVVCQPTLVWSTATRRVAGVCVCVCVCMYVHVCVYIYVCNCMYIYIYIYTYILKFYDSCKGGSVCSNGFTHTCTHHTYIHTHMHIAQSWSPPQWQMGQRVLEWVHSQRCWGCLPKYGHAGGTRYQGIWMEI